MFSLSCLGRFIYGILNDAWQWHQDENLYNSDNRMKGAGGKTVMLPGFMRNFANKDEVDPAELTTWHDIRKVVKKWHRSLTKVSAFHSMPTIAEFFCRVSVRASTQANSCTSITLSLS